MRTKNEAALRQQGGGENAAAGPAFSQPKHTTYAAKPQAPTRELRATFQDGLIYRGGRHLASMRSGVLGRTFDAERELWRGGLLFHTDVLRLAAEHGAQWILCTERETGQRYRIAFADFMRLAWAYDHAVFGEQSGLDLSRWERLPNDGETVQLSLFAEARR